MTRVETYSRKVDCGDLPISAGSLIASSGEEGGPVIPVNREQRPL